MTQFSKKKKKRVGTIEAINFHRSYECGSLLLCDGFASGEDLK